MILIKQLFGHTLVNVPCIFMNTIVYMFSVTDDEMRVEMAGATANVVIIKNNKIYCVSFNCVSYISNVVYMYIEQVI
jgi:hypothetical protein